MGAVPCPSSIREETRANKPFRPDYTHTGTRAEGRSSTEALAHARVSGASGCVCRYLEKNRQLPVGKQLNGTIRPWLRQGDLKVNMSERLRDKADKRPGGERRFFPVEVRSHQTMARRILDIYISPLSKAGVRRLKGGGVGGVAVFSH